MRYINTKYFFQSVDVALLLTVSFPAFSTHEDVLQSYWWPDIALLGIFIGTFIIASYLVLLFYVKERR